MLATHAIAPHARVITACVSLSAHQLLRRNASTSSCSSAGPVVLEGDVVLLKRVGIHHYQKLTEPLKHGRRINTHFGTLNEDDIIGKEYLDNVPSSTGEAVRVFAPTLGEYTTLTPRQVTPIYPDDANLIVSLLDIHAPNRATDDALKAVPRLEILEAGTGHGALTLHLARAVHAANPPMPQVSSTEDSDNILSEWKSRRKAVVHTIDQLGKVSTAAQNVVLGFRRGLYAGNVDFHVGNVTDFIKKYTEAGKHRTFAHVVLDLPDTHRHMSPAAQALQDGGSLLTFCPSVTQIARCVEAVEEHGLPLIHSRVLELGGGISGGRQWDVRRAKIRKSARNTDSATQASRVGMSQWDKIKSFFGLLGPDAGRSGSKGLERWETVARPSVGHTVVGGGFVSLWRRKKL